MPNHSPIWNATLMFDIGNGSNLIDSKIEISLWDLIPQNDSLFLGECSVDLKVHLKYKFKTRCENKFT